MFLVAGFLFWLGGVWEGEGRLFLLFRGVEFTQVDKFFVTSNPPWLYFCVVHVRSGNMSAISFFDPRSIWGRKKGSWGVSSFVLLHPPF